MNCRRSLPLEVLWGALAFGVLSVAAFSVWAFGGTWFRSRGGDPAMYAVIAGVFVLGSGVLLGCLTGGPGRFYRVFVPAFLLYAVIWCAAWFGLGGRLGEWLGAVVGGAAFVLVSLKLLGNTRGWPVVAVVFLVAHCAGYFAGDWAYAYAKANAGEWSAAWEIPVAGVAKLGRLAWGLFYGLGFGAGLAAVFHHGRVGSAE
jgi:hypothetical protein